MTDTKNLHDKLLPCPVCGGKGLIFIYNTGKSYILCNRPKCYHSTRDYKYLAWAIKSWNKSNFKKCEIEIPEGIQVQGKYNIEIEKY